MVKYLIITNFLSMMLKFSFIRFSLTVLLLFFFSVANTHLSGQESLTYREPPAEITDLVDAPATPAIMTCPAAEKILYIENPGLPAIEDLAVKELRLGGIRIDPVTNGPSRARYGIGLGISDIDGESYREVAGLPDDPRIRNVRWSPDGRWVAFTQTVDDGIELWLVDVMEYRAERLTSAIINEALGSAYTWLSDSKTIIISATDMERGEPPARPVVAEGPVVQESIGRKAAVRTYQDLLTDMYDEKIFDYYATSQLYRVDLNGNITETGEPGIIWYFLDSPDGNYLLVNRIERPYSYIVPFSRFLQSVEIIDLNNGESVKIADIPLADDIPQGFDATREGPRNFTWRSDVPSTLFWVEAIDGGDPAAEVKFRDRIYYIEPPFTGEPIEGFKLELRYRGIIWGSEDYAIVNQFWWRDRRMVTGFFNPSDLKTPPEPIFDRSVEDRYNDPGSFQTKTNRYGKTVLHFDTSNRFLYLAGQGATPEGNKPFVDTYDVTTGYIERLWRSEPPYYEYPVRIVDADRKIIMTRRESNDKHPVFYLRYLKDDKLVKVTDLPDPFPQLKNIYNEMIHYEREDGVSLNGRLYLPEGYNIGEDDPLPTVLWAYPREFITADGAGQVTDSPYRYIRLGATSPVMLVTQGYAVLSNASFPVVGEEDKEPNDTFIEQLIANAEAAVSKLAGMGVTDPERVAISGHSYGAFMAANLLSHTDMFAAGIARSGAYNRLLTPFGFQREERTFWQDSDLYIRMSPFSYAHQMNTPILLIHGADDNNAGTYPMQSERYYDALRGNGATVRLVMLPHESHGYRARESILHMHWEWVEWLDRYVKDRDGE